MSLPNLLSALLAAVVLGLLAWHLVGGRPREVTPCVSPDDDARRRRERVAWEVRGLVIAVAGPIAAGIFFGYVSNEYVLPLMLFILAGFLVAGLIAPADRHAHR